MADQGCPGEGTDTRIFGRVTCWLQRQFSWKSTLEPYKIILGPLYIAWPPFTALQIPISQTMAEWFQRKKLPASKQWYLLARMGARYDSNWGGYICPEAALKVLDHLVHQ